MLPSPILTLSKSKANYGEWLLLLNVISPLETRTTKQGLASQQKVPESAFRSSPSKNKIGLQLGTRYSGFFEIRADVEEPEATGSLGSLRQEELLSHTHTKGNLGKPACHSKGGCGASPTPPTPQYKEQPALGIPAMVKSQLGMLIQL